MKVKDLTFDVQNVINNQKCECLKILIVDDDPFNIIALTGLLS